MNKINTVERLIQETIKRMDSVEILPFEYRFIGMFKHISPLEREIVEKELLAVEYSAVGLRIFEILQEEIQIMSITEYIHNIDDPVVVQCIMSDLLETEYSSLLVNLIQNAYDNNSQYSYKMSLELNECFSLIVSDLAKDPNIIKANYLATVIKFLSLNEKNLVIKEHIKLFLQIDACSIAAAMKQQVNWIEEDSSMRLDGSTLNQIMLSTIPDINTSIDELLNIATQKVKLNFSWKYYLKYLRLICKHIPDKKKEIIRKKLNGHLQNMFTQTIKSRSENLFILLLITARHLSASASKDIFSYDDWYRITFSEMGSSINKTEFIYVIELLTKTLSNETATDFLQTHCKARISAPTYCHNYVMTYKQLAKSHLDQLTATNSFSNVSINDEIVIIDEVMDDN